MAEENSEVKKQNKVITMSRDWMSRLRGTLSVLFFIFGVASLIVILKNDLVTKKINDTIDQVLDFVGQRGFLLDDIVVSGRERTTFAELNQALGLKRGDNILKVNVANLKNQLEQLPWVRDVEVRRSLMPNVLTIGLQEKKVLAIWQLNEKFYPLDMDGYVIEADYRSDEPLLLAVGAGAAENLVDLLKMIAETDKTYLHRIRVVNYISKRRWNLIIDDIKNGITIKLPEDNPVEAWKKLLKLDAEKGILKRKLTIIDLRLPDKITVKLRKTKARPVKEQSL